MPDNDEFFTSANIDEQIDFLERRSGHIPGAARPEERLVSHLRHFYGEQAHMEHDSLEHAWQRLVARYQAAQQNGQRKGRIIFMQDYQNGPAGIPAPRQKHTWVQRLGVLAAVLIVGLLVGSMVLVLNAGRQHGGNTQKQQAITGSGGTPQPKPPHPITGGKCTIDTTRPQSQQSTVNLPGLYIFAQNEQSDNVLYRYDPRAKKVVWSIKLCNSFQTNGTVAQNGILYLAGTDWTHEANSGSVSYLYALNESDGSALWGIQFPAKVVNPTSDSSVPPTPAETPSRVLTPTPPGLTPVATPFPHPSPLDLGMIETPTIVNNILYVVQRSGMVYAYNATTGGQLWTFDSGRDAWATTGNGGGSLDDPSSVQVVNGVAYFSIVDRVYALDAQSGKELWGHSFANALNINQSPAIDNGTVYVTAFVPGYGTVMHPDTYLYAFDAQTGAQKWVTRKLSGYINGPLAYQGAVYALGYDGTWYTLDPSNGAIKAQKILTQYASIQLINGVFYDIADYGMLFVLNPDGSAKWSIQLRGQYPGLADVQKGIMYITTRDSGIYAYSATGGSFLWHYEGYLPQPQSNLIMTVVS